MVQVGDEPRLPVRTLHRGLPAVLRLAPGGDVVRRLPSQPDERPVVLDTDLHQATSNFSGSLITSHPNDRHRPMVGVRRPTTVTFMAASSARAMRLRVSSMAPIRAE